MKNNLEALREEIAQAPDTRLSGKILRRIDQLISLLENYCSVCGKTQDEDGRCGCTNKNS
jgi:hypothetical protein